MDEADAEPLRDEAGLPCDDRIEQRPVGPFVGLGFRVVPSNDVVGKDPDGLGVPARGEILEGPDAHMTARHAGEHGPGQIGLAVDGLAGRHRSERARGRDAERVHALADDVLTQDRPEPRPPVAGTRKGRAPGTLELNIEALAAWVEDLAQEDRPSVAELRHKAPELMAGVGHGQRLRAVRHRVSGQHGEPVGRAQLILIEPEIAGERLVELHQPRSRTAAGDCRA